MTQDRRRAAVIVSVGNELLSGETVDSNAAWLGRVLNGWGLPVVRGLTVGDRVADIQDAVRGALTVADVVVVTGGLGATPDDVTKGAVADLLGVRLVADTRVRESVLARFRASGMDRVPDLAEGQADVPEGGIALGNDQGTAPGILLDRDEGVLVLLPGVPHEMRGIVEGPLRGAFLERGLIASGLHHHTIRTTGIEEPALAELVEARLRALPQRLLEGVDLAYLPDELCVALRFSIRRVGPEEAAARLGAIDVAVGPTVAPWRFDAESGDIAESVARALRERGLTIAVAESCTGGLLAERLTDHPGASDVVVGGIVAYANVVKVAQLGVSPATLEQDGAVSERVACQMATGAAARLGARVGVGVTGVAGPGGGTATKPVGTVWIAVDVEGDTRARLLRVPGDRGAIRRRSAQAALAEVLRRLRPGAIGA